MKTVNKMLSIVPVCLGLLTACDGMWDEKTNNEWDPKYVWSVSDVAQGVLYKVYTAIPTRPDQYDGYFLDVATDNALTNKFGSALYQLANGQLSATNNPLGNWSSCYQQFQYINSFLENGLTENTKYDKVDPEKDAVYKKRLKGEAFFLRAFWGFNLLQQYGGKSDDGRALGYPITIHFISQEQAADKTAFERNTYEECARQIISDCDTAMLYLPLKYEGSDPIIGVTEVGRATALAAAALKSRAALYAASPAYQPNTCTIIQEMGRFEVRDEEKYCQQWAYTAMVADTVLRLEGFGDFYALKATDLADAPNITPAEFLFRVFYKSRDVEQRNFPPYYLGKANTVPSQNLVDAFPMKNGYPVTVDNAISKYDPKFPYENRDKRFYLNIYYHKAKFGGTGTPIDVIYGGKDSPSYSPLATRSGYYLSKFLSNKGAPLDPTTATNAQYYYPIIRKTEVYLNFAEAANEAWGPKSKDPKGLCKYTAYDVIKTIRHASGGITNTKYLDQMAADKDSFRKLIQNERRLELAFENHRYYDMRRWLLPLNESVRGVEVTKDENGEDVYSVKEVEARMFNNICHYYSPLPYNECVKNPNLINNLGWK